MSAQSMISASNSSSRTHDELVAEWVRQVAMTRPTDGATLHGGTGTALVPADLWLRVEGL